MKRMARIAGVDIPNNKRVEIALTYIYGIGRKSANDILAKTGINPDTRAKDLTEDEVAKLRDEIENSYTVEGDLRRDVAMNIKRMARKEPHSTAWAWRLATKRRNAPCTNFLSTN